MPNLESLILKYLGLRSLPEGISEMKQLKKFSFNYIKVSDELDQLMKIENLEELVIFGLSKQKSDIKKLRESNKKLEILHTQQQHMDWFESRGKAPYK